MTGEKSVSDIRARFGVEKAHIDKFVGFLQSKSAIHDHEVSEIRGVLRSWNLAAPSVRDETKRGPSGYTQLECADLLKMIDELKLELDSAIDEAHSLLNDTSINDDGIEEMSPLTSEWVNYLLENYSHSDLRNSREGIIYQCLIQAEREDNDAHEQTDAKLLDRAITYAILMNAFRKYKALKSVKGKLAEFQLRAKVTEPDSQINVLRQGFILLMTAFDAAIFDLVRFALQKKFFSLVVSFGKQESIKYQDLAQAGGFDALRDQIIELQLKKRYVKDLLYMLANEWKVEFVDKSSGAKFERIIEFVLRRNLHVHNRGIVDERYLDQKTNLDNLKLGENAVIDAPYWELSKQLLNHCVERVAIWADKH
jgi:hypothetical protein